MVRKPIELAQNLRFESISAGKSYFGQMLKDAALEEDVPPHQFEELRLLHERYCANTGWTLTSPPVGFYAIYERNEGYTTKCFAVRFHDGSVDRFSLDKALSAAAISV